MHCIYCGSWLVNHWIRTKI